MFAMIRNILFACSAAILLLGCADDEKPNQGPVYSHQSKNGKPVYHLAIHPLHNPRTLIASYQPLADYLNEHVDSARFVVESSRDYQAYEEKFRNRQPEFILPNPWQTLEAIKVGYHVIAMAGEAEDFRGIFIVKKDSQIKIPTDLIGKKVAYPSRTALAAAIMPQRFLYDHGVNVTKDIENTYVGSQESAIMNVLLGETDAGATWPPPWRLYQSQFPEEAARLKIIWETPSLMNNSLMARDDIPKEIVSTVADLLFQLHQHGEGLNILKQMQTARFIQVDDAAYDQVKVFIEQFEHDIRLVEDADSEQ